MVVCRVLGILVGVLAAVPLAWGQTWSLAEPIKAGDCTRIKLEMSLAGELRVHKDGQVVPIKLEASATHEFPERVLNVGKTGLPEKTARVYDLAKAVIRVGGNASERSLRGERHLLVAQRHNDQPLVYCPNGALRREELELTSEHFDTLSLTGLLPTKPVAVGETWKVANAVAQALCNFEGLTEQDLTCKLEEAKNGSARVSVTGSASGIEMGAMVRLKVQASYQFDLGAKKLAQLEWQQTDERDQGPASPATGVRTTTKVTRVAIPQPACLDDVALVSVPDGFEPPPPLLQIDYRDPKGRFEMLHGREWQTVGQTDEHLILRLMERGDFVAQVTLTPWKPIGKAKLPTLEEFRDEMNKTPGWEPEKELQAGEVPTTDKDGNKIYRISALGNMDGTPVMQNFYLVAGPGGEQLVLLFTLTPKKAPKLAERDLAMAGSIEFPSNKKPAADKPK
jgi:hypothetical protein